MSFQCLNGGQFIINQTSNESYCRCDTCYQGMRCEDLIEMVQVRFDYEYHRLIIYSMELCLSLLNNLLSLAVFLGSKRIRRTNVGIYLVIYSITSIVGNIQLVIGQSVYYYKPYPFANNEDLSTTFLCYLEKSGYQVTEFLCLCLSALVAVERNLIICFSFKMNATRWRSLITLIPMLCIVIATSVSWVLYRCERSDSDEPTTTRLSGWFYTANGLAGFTYIVATLMALISLALRIYYCGNTQESKMKISFKLIKTHIVILIPPIIYLLCVLPYLIWFPLRGAGKNYFQCEITLVEYIFKLIVQTMPNCSSVFTWLIFVWPSNVFRTEFYEETWIGLWLSHLRSVLRNGNASCVRVLEDGNASCVHVLEDGNAKCVRVLGIGYARCVRVLKNGNAR